MNPQPGLLSDGRAASWNRSLNLSCRSSGESGESWLKKPLLTVSGFPPCESA